VGFVPSSAEAQVAELLREIEAEFGGFRLVPKERSRSQRAIHLFLCAVTLGGQRAYLERYVTTIGRTIYVNRGWEARTAEDRIITLRHERIHLRQFQRYGTVGMAILYLLLPLPLGLAGCRAWLEREAYEETLHAMCEIYGPGHLERPDVRRHIVAQFVGPAYGWMWPFRGSVERWYDRAAQRMR
jgi:hypothetical protein